MKVLVGSKLPHSLVLRNPIKATEIVIIKGLNSAPRLIGGMPLTSHVTTEVDAGFWDLWYAQHSQPDHMFGPLKSGALFVAKTQDAIDKMARDSAKERTGLEQLSKDAVALVSPVA